jgi:hypothetical protein
MSRKVFWISYIILITAVWVLIISNVAASF